MTFAPMFHSAPRFRWIGFLSFTMAVMVAMAVSRPIMAQPSDGPGRLGPGGPPDPSLDPALMILELPKVRHELALNASQEESVKKITKEFRESMDRDLDAPNDKARLKTKEVEDKIRTLIGDGKAKLGNILRKQQMERLDELGLQARGALALSDPQVQRQLKLNDDQCRELRSFTEKLDSDIIDIVEASSKLNLVGRLLAMKQDGPKVQKLVNDASKSMLQVLSVAQQQQFETLKGPKANLTWALSGP